MKHEALYSSRDKSKKLKCHLLQFGFGALWVNLVVMVESGTFDMDTHFKVEEYR